MLEAYIEEPKTPPAQVWHADAEYLGWNKYGNYGQFNQEQGQTPKVAGAEETPAHAYPNIVVVEIGPTFCGGSLIDENWVLAAAHCIDGTVNQGNITLGEHDRSIADGEVSIKPLAVFIHPKFNEAISYEYDIALILLSQSAPKIPGVIAPIGITETEALSGSLATLVGWGKTDKVDHAVNVLRHANAQIISTEACNEFYGSGITSNMLCAYNLGVDACEGDSGGPLIINGIQHGIFSWSEMHCDGKYPSVSTNVTAFNDWIIQTLKDNPRQTVYLPLINR